MMREDQQKIKIPLKWKSSEKLNSKGIFFKKSFKFESID
jgi:hypothetical protein